MYIRVRKQIILVVIVLMVSGVLNSVLVSSQHQEISDATLFINIDSRFKLWDTNEKMIDSKFNITLVYLNQSSNNTAYYKIDIDNVITEGYFTNHTKLEFQSNETLIHYLNIYINNKTVLSVKNIIITNQVSKSLIDYANSQWTINLSPWEWTQKERNVYAAAIVSFLISLPMTYLIIKTGKKGRGIKTHK